MSFVQIEGTAKCALPQYSEGISVWTELLQAVQKGNHKLWGNDVGKDTVQRMVACWQPLSAQGSSIDDNTASAFLARVNAADRQTVARKCVWAPTGRRLWNLQQAPIMKQPMLGATQQAISSMLQNDLANMTEHSANKYFYAVIDCARSARDKLWQEWMTSDRDL